MNALFDYSNTIVLNNAVLKMNSDKIWEFSEVPKGKKIKTFNKKRKELADFMRKIFLNDHDLSKISNFYEEHCIRYLLTTPLDELSSDEVCQVLLMEIMRHKHHESIPSKIALNVDNGFEIKESSPNEMMQDIYSKLENSDFTDLKISLENAKSIIYTLQENNKHLEYNFKLLRYIFYRKSIF